MSHTTRADLICGYITRNPGSAMPEIADALGVPRSNICSHLTELLRAGRICRAGLRCDYVYFTDQELCRAASAEIEAQLIAERAERRKRTVEASNAARAARRAARRAAPGVVIASKPGRPRKAPELRIDGRLKAYIDAHQGCLYKELLAGGGVNEQSVGRTLRTLVVDGVVSRVGTNGPGGYRYYTDRALYESALADHTARLTKAQQERAQAVADRHAKERERIEARQREREAKERAAAAAKAAAAAQKAAEKARKEAWLMAKAAADAEREQAPVSRGRMPQRKTRNHTVSLRPSAPSVTLPSRAAESEPIITDKTVFTRAEPPQPWRQPIAQPIRPGEGVISGDWAARRAGAYIPSRLNGVY